MHFWNSAKILDQSSNPCEAKGEAEYSCNCTPLARVEGLYMRNYKYFAFTLAW
jgi:hypothetical protein